MSKKFEKNYLLKKSKYFCMLPWIHTHVLPSSEVIPCCVWPYNKSLGNVSNSSLKEIINNDEYNRLERKCSLMSQLKIVDNAIKEIVQME